MGLLSLFGFGGLPPGIAGATLVVGEGAALQQASALLDGLQSKLGPIALGYVGDATYSGALPSFNLAPQPDKAAALMRKIQPARLIILALRGDQTHLVRAAACPAYWINARDHHAANSGCNAVTVSDPKLMRSINGAVLTGNPLLNITQLPGMPTTNPICERFKEQRESGRWLGYFAATGEGEEEIAYAIFNRLIRHKMGLMILAPQDPARCEPVYRESIKYRLQTIRHNRLSTSFVPLQTRVYYIEEPQPLAALYACVDFVVAGGTLHSSALQKPDLITPLLHGKPVIVGSAQRDDGLVRAALADNAVLGGNNEEQVFQHARGLLDAPSERERLGAAGKDWLQAQVGALARVLALIE